MAGLEDKNAVQSTSAQPEADAGPPLDRNARPGEAGRVFLSVICGALVGALLAIILAPDFVVAFAIGGALSFGAGAVMRLLFRSQGTESQGGAGTGHEAEKE